jgi:hypothetical protein
MSIEALDLAGYVVAAGVIGSAIESAGGGVSLATGRAETGGGPAGASCGIHEVGGVPTTTAPAWVMPVTSTKVSIATIVDSRTLSPFPAPADAGGSTLVGSSRQLLINLLADGDAIEIHYQDHVAVEAARG